MNNNGSVELGKLFFIRVDGLRFGYCYCYCRSPNRNRLDGPAGRQAGKQSFLLQLFATCHAVEARLFCNWNRYRLHRTAEQQNSAEPPQPCAGMPRFPCRCATTPGSGLWRHQHV